MRFVENVNLEPIARRTITRRFAQFSNLVDAPIRGGVDLDHIDRITGANFGTRLADATGLDRRLASCFIGGAAVQRHRQDAGDGRLANSAMPAEDVTVRDALLRNGILQGAGDVFLADDFGEFLRTVFARQDLVAHRNPRLYSSNGGYVRPLSQNGGAGRSERRTFPQNVSSNKSESRAPEVGTAERVAARQGFEPRYAAPEAAVLPLNDRAVQEF